MLLMSVHDYFMGLGVDEIRRRGAEDDKPLRMVKTILHELCKLKVCNSIIAATSVCHSVSNSSLWVGLTICGKATNFSRMSSWHTCWKQTANDDPFPGWQGLEIKEHMRDIPQNCDPAPIIHIYVDLNLQTLYKAGVISGPVPLPDAAPDSAPPSSSAVQAERGNSIPLGSMHSAGGSSGQLAQTAAENSSGRAANGVAETSPLSSAGSMPSPGSQASRMTAVVKLSEKKVGNFCSCLSHARVWHTSAAPSPHTILHMPSLTHSVYNLHPGLRRPHKRCLIHFVVLFISALT